MRLWALGVLGSAPIAAHRMRNPRWGFLAAVAAGPLSNLLLAVVTGIGIQLSGISPFAIINGEDLVSLLLRQMVLMNVLLFFFNILPLFPIDGWHIVLALLPPELAMKWRYHQQNSYYVFIGLIIYTISLSYLGIRFLPDIFGILISQPTWQTTLALIGLG